MWSPSRLNTGTSVISIVYQRLIASISSILTFILFADDTNVFFSHTSLDKLFDVMNIELIKVAEWFNANKLSLNLEKTNFILFSSARKTASRKALFLNGISLNQTHAVY